MNTDEDRSGNTWDSIRAQVHIPSSLYYKKDWLSTAANKDDHDSGTGSSPSHLSHSTLLLTFRWAIITMWSLWVEQDRGSSLEGVCIFNNRDENKREASWKARILTLQRSFSH